MPCQACAIFWGLCARIRELKRPTDYCRWLDIGNGGYSLNCVFCRLAKTKPRQSRATVLHARHSCDIADARGHQLVSKRLRRSAGCGVSRTLTEGDAEVGHGWAERIGTRCEASGRRSASVVVVVRVCAEGRFVLEGVRAAILGRVGGVGRRCRWLWVGPMRHWLLAQSVLLCAVC